MGDEGVPIINGAASSSAVEVFGGSAALQATTACSSVEELIAQATADVAKAVALFGPGVTVLPVVGHLSGVAAPACLSYEASLAGASFVDTASAAGRFGALDPDAILRELAGGDALLVKARVADLSDGELQAEVAALQAWRGQAAGRIKLLERRAAWALVGLEEGSAASASEVRRAFKRRALTLHPDKGGDPKRFQLLQEMKQLLVKPLEKGSCEDDGCKDGDSDSDSDHAVEEAQTKTKQEDSPAGDASPAVFDRRKVESERWNLHNDVCDLWVRCEQLGAEIELGPTAGGGNAGRILQRLRGFVHNFMARNADASAVEAIHRFLEEGAEELGAASAVDPGGASAVVSLYLGVPLAARSESPEMQNLFAALVEAIYQVPLVLERHVRPAGAQKVSAEQAELLGDVAANVVGEATGDAAVVAAGASGTWDDLGSYDCAGARRPDGSGIYCTACESWITLMPPFDPACFQQHCDTDVMHSMLVGGVR